MAVGRHPGPGPAPRVGPRASSVVRALSSRAAGSDPHHAWQRGEKIGRSRPIAMIFPILWLGWRLTTTSSASRPCASGRAGSGPPPHGFVSEHASGEGLAVVALVELSPIPGSEHDMSDYAVTQIASLKRRSQVSCRLASWRVRVFVCSMAASRLRRPSMRPIASV